MTLLNLQSTGADVTALCQHLETRGSPALAACSNDDLARAWSAAWTDLSDGRGGLAEGLVEEVARNWQAHPDTVRASLDVMLRGAAPSVFGSLLARADSLEKANRRPFLVNLAATPVGLATQCVLPALAARRPLLLRSSEREPLFAKTLVERLVFHAPVLGDALAAVTWPSSRQDLAQAALRAVARVIVYGGERAISEWEALSGTLTAFGPRISIAVILGSANEDTRVAEGLAADIALFDQGGCLSLQWIASDRSEALARGLSEALRHDSKRLPPRRLELAEASRARIELTSSALQGEKTSWVEPGVIGAGTVIESIAGSAPRPSPGARCVRVHPVAATTRSIIQTLASWGDHLQGAVVCSDSPALRRDIDSHLTALGVTHLAAPGELQAVDVTWKNGGLDPLELYARD